MVSTNPSYDVEHFKSAYENISLISDNIWSNNRKNTYRKLNQALWIQNIKINEYFDDEKSRKYVNDIIPKSKLSKYGNYEYNIFRENYYKKSTNDAGFNSKIKNKDDNSTELWLQPDVEKYFIKLTKPNLVEKKNSHSSLTLLSGIKNNDTLLSSAEEYKKYRKYPYVIKNEKELKLQLKILDESVKSLWITKKKSSQSPSNNETTRLVNCFRCKKSHRVPQNCKKKGSRCRYEEVCNIHHTVIISKNRYKGRDNKSNNKNSNNGKITLPILSPEVPEFFPKNAVYSEYYYESVPLQYFPSLTDKIYQRIPIQNVSTVFQNPGIPLLAAPIVTPVIRSSPHWIPRLSAAPLQIQIPVCTLTTQQQQTFTSTQSSLCPIIHRPIQIQEKIIQPNQQQTTTTQIPVYQRPTDQYTEQRNKKSCGVDFNNLILLTKNTMKIRNYQSKTLNCDPAIIHDLTKKFINAKKLVNDLQNFDDKFQINQNSDNHDSSSNHNDDESIDEENN